MVRNRVFYLLIQKLQITKKEAKALVEGGQVFLNEQVVSSNVFFTKKDTIYFKNEVLQVGKKVLTIAFYKPRGIETTLNQDISDNLKALLPFEEHLFPIGRLDKESEGLLLLTNDGDLYHQLIHCEKEYIVKTDKIITDDFVKKMASGVQILGQTTLACSVTKNDDFTFQIILKQGLNRQIRRMCYQLGYQVTELKRIRIDKIELGDLEAGQFISTLAL